MYADRDGFWVAPELNRQMDAWMPRGVHLGSIVTDAEFEFKAVVSQEQASSLFEKQSLEGQVRLHGLEAQNQVITGLEVIPYEIEDLPSAALGWFGGGDIAVKQGEGTAAVESFFLIEGMLPEIAKNYRYHGRTGILRIPLPDRSMFFQIKRFVVQLFQKRYQI